MVVRLTRSDFLAAARLAAGLPRFLRDPVDLGQARAIVERRRARRGPDFLELLRTGVYAVQGSPYRALLDHAGCQYGDVAHLVERDGLEAALATLYRAGVYVTVEELKGRRPIARGSLVIEPAPTGFHNRARSAHGVIRTSGSRGAPGAVPLTLDFLRDVTVDMRVSLAAWGSGPWSLAYWDVPGSVVFYLITYPRCGLVPSRWFSLVDAADPRFAARYRWSARALRWASRAAGVRLPPPETTPIDAPLPLARWMASTLSAGETPLLLTYPSPAVRLCRAAIEAGIDLTGAQLRLYGEPLSATRLEAIRRSGAEALALYASVETWRIGEPCLEPTAPDDVHLIDDLYALVQPGAGAARSALPPRALLLTSLRATAPVLLLNASLGDEAVVSTRSCGCPLERLGWNPHLAGIRSYEKVTAAGMTFLDIDIVRVLEHVLPTRFGGGPTDYQLVEDETADGRPRIRLLVHPAIGGLDPGAVSREFLNAIGAGSGPGAVMARALGDAAAVTVERRAPLTTATGKILHVHLDRGRSSPT